MSRDTAGLLLGLLGVVIFGGTLPFTRLAVAELDPWFVTAGRAAGAGLFAAVLLTLLRRPWPDRLTLRRLLVAAVCLAGLFPGFIGLALKEVDASHGGVVLGILPLATAAMSALLTGERPSSMFWLAAAAGAAIVVGFSLVSAGGAIGRGDLLLGGAVIASAYGYVLSGQVAQTGRPGWEVISWILVIALPATLPAAWWFAPSHPDLVPTWSWIGFAYATVMSQYLGFFAWNAGLALGGIARVSQVQLLQTFVTLAIAMPLNGERVGITSWLVAGAVVAVVMVAQRSRVAHRRVR